MPQTSFNNPGAWQLYGDGEDLTIAMEGGDSFLFKRVFISTMSVNVNQDMIDIGGLDGYQSMMPGMKSVSVDLSLIPQSAEYVTGGELWLPDKQIRKLSITELFGIINDKIDRRG